MGNTRTARFQAVTLSRTFIVSKIRSKCVAFYRFVTVMCPKLRTISLSNEKLTVPVQTDAFDTV